MLIEITLAAAPANSEVDAPVALNTGRYSNAKTSLFVAPYRTTLLNAFDAVIFI